MRDKYLESYHVSRVSSETELGKWTGPSAGTQILASNNHWTDFDDLWLKIIVLPVPVKVSNFRSIGQAVPELGAKNPLKSVLTK